MQGQGPVGLGGYIGHIYVLDEHLNVYLYSDDLFYKLQWVFSDYNAVHLIQTRGTYQTCSNYEAF